MFHFPSFPPHRLYIQRRVTPHDWCWVSPFGNPRITARLTAPRGISQPPTSFIGSLRQGIHRAPLDTYNTQNTHQTRDNQSHHKFDAPFMTSSAKKTQQNAYTETCKITETKTTPPDTNDPASWLMLASTIQFSNNTHHHTATSPIPKGTSTPTLTRSSKTEKTCPLRHPTVCRRNPTHRTSRPAGNKNYRVSVPPNNMSDRQTTVGFETALNAP